jgi:hypothetical protein
MDYCTLSLHGQESDGRKSRFLFGRRREKEINRNKRESERERDKKREGKE